MDQGYSRSEHRRRSQEESSTHSDKSSTHLIDFAAMTLDDRARRRGSTSSASGASGDSVTTRPDSQAEIRDPDPERTIYKDKILEEAKDYFERYKLCMKEFDRCYEEHGSLKYVFDAEHEYSTNIEARKEIEDISHIYTRTEGVKFNHALIIGNLLDYDTIPIERATKAKEIIEWRMAKHKEILDWLENLNDYLLLKPED